MNDTLGITTQLGKANWVEISTRSIGAQDMQTGTFTRKWTENSLGSPVHGSSGLDFSVVSSLGFGL